MKETKNKNKTKTKTKTKTKPKQKNIKKEQNKTKQNYNITNTVTFSEKCCFLFYISNPIHHMPLFLVTIIRHILSTPFASA